MTRKHRSTLRELAHEMYQWECAQLLARPPGAKVKVVPKKASPQTIMRYVVSPRGTKKSLIEPPPRCPKAMGISNYKAARVPFLTPANKKKRVQFCNANIHRNWDEV